MILYKKITKQEADFYPLLGPLFASRVIGKEMDGQIYDTPESTWIVSLSDGVVVGCVSVLVVGKKTVLDNFYVAPEHRTNGIGQSLLDHINPFVPVNCSLVTKDEKAKKMFLAMRFEAMGNRGSYVTMIKR